MAAKKKKKWQYVDRDVSWMYFNHRILQEASKQDLPPLERLSFLGIYSNNLDEFFRVRMASLSRLLETDDKSMRRQVAGIKKTIATINRLNATYSQEYADVIIPASEIFITIADALGCDRVQVPNICLADCITDGLYRGKTAAAL